MKKLWVNLLAVLLFAALAMTCAGAEADEEIILGDGLEVEVQVEAADDGIVLEDDLSMDAPELPVLGENDGIALDLSLENAEAITASPDNAVESNDDAGDFQIINGILVKYKGAGGDVVIPNSVTVIGESAFSRCDSLTSVTIPGSVTSIGGGAFYYCSSLTSVSIPGSVTSIGGSAFSGCSSLTSVTIGSGLTYISSGMFSGCTLLESIELPANISSISGSAFNNCYSLLNVTLLNGSMDISDDAFSGCPTGMTFHTPCDSTTTKWAEGKDYTVVKSDHTPVADPAVAPTCGKSGLTEGTHCSVCSAVIKAQEEVPALAHTPVKDPAVAPTCTKTGLTEGSHCSVCGKILVKQRTVAKVEHTYVIDDAVAPTCTKAGKTAGAHCSVCGKVFVKQKSIPKLISLKKCTITGIKPAIYTGKAIKPTPVVKYNGKKLVKGTDYTVKYAANKAVGIARVTITGKGKYGESVSKTFKISPKAVALVGLTAGKQQLTVTWKKGVVNTWYEIQYGLKKNFAGAKTIAIKKAATVKTVLKNLTTGKTYYVRIRAYKTVNGKKYYSAWSKAMSAKVK